MLGSSLEACSAQQQCWETMNRLSSIKAAGNAEKPSYGPAADDIVGNVLLSYQGALHAGRACGRRFRGSVFVCISLNATLWGMDSFRIKELYMQAAPAADDSAGA